MTITVNTGNFIGLLGDAIQTSDQKSKQPLGIHLSTHRGGYGAEPGVIDLLAATSTDRFMVGHGFIPAEGQMPACVWPLDAVRTAQRMCKEFSDARGSDHTVDIEMSKRTADDGEVYYLVTLRETPALFEADTKFEFRAATEEGYPLKGVWRALTGQPSPKKYTQSNEVGWSPRLVAAVSAIAKRQKESMWWYRTPGSPTWRVQIGGSWIGAINPVVAAPGTSRSEPSVDTLLHPQDGWDDAPLVDAEVVDENDSGSGVVEPTLFAIEAAPAALPVGESDAEPDDDEDDIIDAEVIEDDEDDVVDAEVIEETDESPWDAEVDGDVVDAEDNVGYAPSGMDEFAAPPDDTDSAGQDDSDADGANE